MPEPKYRTVTSDTATGLHDDYPDPDTCDAWIVLRGVDVGTVVMPDDDNIDVRVIEAAEWTGGFLVRFRDGVGSDARTIVVDVGGRAARWLAGQLARMIERSEGLA